MRKWEEFGPVLGRLRGISVRGKMTEASAPLYYETRGRIGLTVYQTADAQHRASEAVRLAVEWVEAGC